MRFWFLLLTSLITLPLLSNQTPAYGSDDDCRPADAVNYVQGGDECLAIQTYLPSDPASAKALVIVLHGDLSRGGPADYTFPIAQRAAELGAIGVSMMRIGYSGGGRSSTGLASRSESRSEIYTPDEMDAIADATNRLKTHYGAHSVVMIGHSGGAVMTGVILGRHPGLVQRALLLSCPCDVPTWRQINNRKPLSRAESPHDYIESIPAGTMIRLVTGSRDTNTWSRLSRDYANDATAQGLDAQFMEVSGAQHNLDSTMADSEAFKAAITEVISGS
jgi:pimeloyl-ACP methyl ester carboxylesterase